GFSNLAYTRPPIYRSLVGGQGGPICEPTVQERGRIQQVVAPLIVRLRHIKVVVRRLVREVVDTIRIVEQLEMEHRIATLGAHSGDQLTLDNLGASEDTLRQLPRDFTITHHKTIVCHIDRPGGGFGLGALAIRNERVRADDRAVPHGKDLCSRRGDQVTRAVNREAVTAGSAKMRIRRVLVPRYQRGDSKREG